MEGGYDPRYDSYTSDEYPPDWEGRRERVLERDGYTCQGCGVTSTRVDSVFHDVDHVVPKSEGGSHALGNLQTLCPACHAEKHPDNDSLARRAREFQRRNRPSGLWRLLRVLLVVPVALSALSGDDGVVTDEHGRRLEVVPVGALDGLPEGEGVTVEVRVATLWDPSTDAIGQVGLFAPADSSREDDVPLVKFTAWADGRLPTLREGARYRVVGAETGRYEGDVQLSLDSGTAIQQF